MPMSFDPKTPELEQAIRDAARAAGVTVSDWIRTALAEKVQPRPADVQHYIGSVAQHYGRSEHEIADIMLADHVAREKARHEITGEWSPDFITAFQPSEIGKMPTLDWTYKTQHQKYRQQFVAARAERLLRDISFGVPLHEVNQEFLREHGYPWSQEEIDRRNATAQQDIEASPRLVAERETKAEQAEIERRMRERDAKEGK